MSVSRARIAAARVKVALLEYQRDEVPMWLLHLSRIPLGTGVCHCGSEMDDHSFWDTHSPVEMMYEWKDGK